MNRISTEEMAAQLPEMIERIKKGEPFTLMENNRQIAEIIPSRHYQAERKKAVEKLKEFQEKNQITLGGLKIRDLIDEGRRFL